MQELPQALSNAWQRGVSDFVDEILHPTITSPAFMAEVEGVINAISDAQMADWLTATYSTPSASHSPLTWEYCRSRC